MKILNSIYWISGIPYGNNSNTYAIDAGDELILIDTGFKPRQWEVMKANMQYWGIDQKPITHAFLTHAHFDHSGNAKLIQEAGVVLVAGDEDATQIEQAGMCTLKDLFASDFPACKIDIKVKDQDAFSFGNIDLKVIALPGHTKGSLGFEVISDGLSSLFIGDFFSILSASPQEELNIELGWQGSPDFDLSHYLASLEKASEFNINCICPGHLSPYIGDCRSVFEKAYEKSLSLVI